MVHDVKIQASALIFLIMLSMDSLNPIKTLCKYFGIASTSPGIAFTIALAFTLYQNASDALYYCVRIFFHSILSMFFKTIDVVGIDNIPQEGPVIFTGNHANQFADGIVVMMNCRRKTGFIIAEKSWNAPIIGYLSKAIGCIPVARPQDLVKVGTGKVTCVEADDGSYILKGVGTSFLSEVHPADQVRVNGATVLLSGSPVKVLEVISDSELKLAGKLVDNKGNLGTDSDFGILPHIDQSKMFENVYTHLKRGNCIGIFPEGGSHDRTDLLPLKAGVALMVFGAKDKYRINVPVVPIGLNYFRGHRFRGRVVVEFGAPIRVDQALWEKYAINKREACNEFLHRVEDGMRSVIVTAPDYNTLQLIYTARRLYQPTGSRLSAKQTQDLNRRFAEGYKLLEAKHHEALPVLQEKLEGYRKTLRLMGLKDHQVPYIPWWSAHDVISSAIYGSLVFALASIPTFILNAPVGIAARYVADQARVTALAGSKVKISGRDVMLSKKITFSMVAVPALWISYAIVACIVTDWYYSSIFLLFLCCPLFSYFGVRTVEAGIIEFKNISPLLYRLLPSYRQIQDKLPLQRAQLQHELRAFISSHADELGEVAQPKKIDWSAYMRAHHPEEHGSGNQEAPLEASRITKDHDISVLNRNTNSSINLSGLVSSPTHSAEDKKNQ